MKFYDKEVAWCAECGCGVPVYAGGNWLKRGDLWLADACCYEHGWTAERAFFNVGNPADASVPKHPQTPITHHISQDFEGSIWE